MKIGAFAASNSTSTNKTLVRDASSQLEGVNRGILDLNDYDMPFYSTVNKNILDWCSRINPKLYRDKPMALPLILSGSSSTANVYP